MILDKATVRHGILAARDSLTRDERLVKSLAIGLKLSEQIEYIESGTILFYLNFRSEAATRKMIETALADGKKVLLPKVDRKAHRLKLFEVKDLEADIEAGYMGIYEPVEGVARLASSEEANLVIMPGVGFDSAGRRLGYGGGYYDRLIETLRPDTSLIALAFDAQVVDEIPAEEHDKKVDKIITETRVIKA